MDASEHIAFITGLKPGDRVYRWVWTGGEHHDIQPLTVVRVNQVTVTVETDQGSRFRINPVAIEDYYRDDPPAEAEKPLEPLKLRTTRRYHREAPKPPNARSRRLMRNGADRYRVSLG
jgi:hypothetical protein